MSPNLKSDHHIILSFPEKWVIRAKELWEDEQLKATAKGYKNIFTSENAWAGKIGEWAVKTVYKDFIPITQHYNPTKYDFKSPNCRLTYEVKTNAADRPFENRFHFNVNDRQYKENDNDIYIACYFFPRLLSIRLCGWLYKNMVETRGFKVSKGNKLGGGNVAKSDFWKVSYKELNSMHLMPDR